MVNVWPEGVGWRGVIWSKESVKVIQLIIRTLVFQLEFYLRGNGRVERHINCDQSEEKWKKCRYSVVHVKRNSLNNYISPSLHVSERSECLSVLTRRLFPSSTLLYIFYRLNASIRSLFFIFATNVHLESLTGSGKGYGEHDVSFWSFFSVLIETILYPSSEILQYEGQSRTFISNTPEDEWS